MIIQKIKIQTSLNEIEAAVEALLSLSNEVLPFRRVKTSHSVLNQVDDILRRKLITKKQSKKEFSLSLEFYQAHYLEEFIRVYNGIDYNNQLQKLCDKLNQKLA